jgi:hypothetical protein
MKSIQVPVDVSRKGVAAQWFGKALVVTYIKDGGNFTSRTLHYDTVLVERGPDFREDCQRVMKEGVATEWGWVAPSSILNIRVFTK